MGKYRKKHEWAAVFEEQQRSGLSIIEFCKQHAISTTNFYKVRANIRGKTSGKPAFIKATITKDNDNPNVTSTSQVLRLTTKHAQIILPNHCSSQFIVDILKGLQA